MRLGPTSVMPRSSPTPMSEPSKKPVALDAQAEKFLTHLATDRGASVYTQRNYRITLAEFSEWHQEERKSAPDWPRLLRDDFRAYLRFLGRKNLGRAGTQLRFSALRRGIECPGDTRAIGIGECDNREEP